VTSASSSGTERLPGASLGDMPRFAAATQFANVSLGIVSQRDASSSVRPCVSTSFTASSRSSGVYVFARFINSPVGEVYQTGVSEKVSVPQVSGAAARKPQQLKCSHIRHLNKPDIDLTSRNPVMLDQLADASYLPYFRASPSRRRRLSITSLFSSI
jgi:hypothetical protein